MILRDGLSLLRQCHPEAPSLLQPGVVRLQNNLALPRSPTGLFPLNLHCIYLHHFLFLELCSSISSACWHNFPKCDVSRFGYSRIRRCVLSIIWGHCSSPHLNTMQCCISSRKPTLSTYTTRSLKNTTRRQSRIASMPFCCKAFQIHSSHLFLLFLDRLLQQTFSQSIDEAGLEAADGVNVANRANEAVESAGGDSST